MTIKSFILIVFFTAMTIITHGQTPTIGGHRIGNISKDSLMLIKTIDIEAPFKIYSFVMIYFANGTTKEFEGHANILTKEMTEAIKKSKSGERFSFEQINAIGNDGIIHRLKPISLKLK